MFTWWKEARQKDFPSLIPENILDVLARAYAVVEVGGLVGYGPEKGRRFEKLFYDICDRRGVHLSEKAGSKSLAHQRSASGLRHEVDAATRSLYCITHWELKHLTAELPKNELLIFNGKGLDYLYGSSRILAQVPNLRFLLSGTNVRDECRSFGVLWGIMIVQPGLLPMPLLYEAVARGASSCLRDSEREAVKALVPWACRPLQRVVGDLFELSRDKSKERGFDTNVSRSVKSLLALQEQIGPDVADYLDEKYPEWISDLANETWLEVEGW